MTLVNYLCTEVPGLTE